MKGLLKIIRRYSATAGGMILIVLICNVAATLCFFGILGNRTGNFENDTYEIGPVRSVMEQIGGEISEKNGRYEISETGREILEKSDFLWAMAIEPSGAVVWEWQLPDVIPRTYTLQNVASFSRWYLEDYPVNVWSYGDLLLVFGRDPAQQFRFSVMMQREVVEAVPVYLELLLLLNLAVVAAFVVCFGYRFYGSLKPLAEGIDRLSRGEAVRLKEKGLTEELAGKLNRTSQILDEQGRKLRQRDQARTEWIAGVSHDIRTPLALIVGYAEQLADSETLGEEERRMAQTVRRQSLVIGQLIRDLNLTSKLAYGYQPLKRDRCRPGVILRECVADLHNGGLEQQYEITLSVTERAEQAELYADAGLVARALRNVIGNSIRHNPDGCTVEALLFVSGKSVCFVIRDSGPGIPERVVQEMGYMAETAEQERTSGVHIMGLRLTAQIAEAHGGALVFEKRAQGDSYDAKLVLPRGRSGS